MNEKDVRINIGDKIALVLEVEGKIKYPLWELKWPFENVTIGELQKMAETLTDKAKTEPMPLKRKSFLRRSSP